MPWFEEGSSSELASWDLATTRRTPLPSSLSQSVSNTHKNEQGHANTCRDHSHVHLRPEVTAPRLWVAGEINPAAGRHGLPVSSVHAARHRGRKSSDPWEGPTIGRGDALRFGIQHVRSGVGA